MKKKVIVAIILAIVLAVFGYFFFRPKKAVYETQTVEKRDLVQSVSATGELKTDVEVSLNFEISGRVKDMKIRASQTVAEGDILAAVDDNNLNQEVNQAKASLDEALAKANINDDEIDRLESERDNTKEFYDETKDLEDQKIAAADQKYDDAQAYYDDALSYYETVVDESGANSSEAKSAKLTLTLAEADLNNANENKETVEKQAEVNKRSAKNSYLSDQASLDKAESNFQRSFENAEIAGARAAYQEALNNLGKASLKAPVSGTITKVNYEKGEVVSSSFAADPFAKMIAKDFLIEAQVPESDVAKIKIANKGTVYFDSLGADYTLGTEVISIEPASTVIQDVVYYLVKFKINAAPDPRLKSGMTANVEIETDRKNSAVAIPERLVKEEGDKKYVEILGSKDLPERVDVQTGIRADEGFIEITRGLKEGDKIIL